MVKRVAPEGSTALGGRYVLGSVLGRGGMADVHRARDALLGREVAVKLLRDVAGDERGSARFAAEARTLARLNHPGLVTVLDAGFDGDRPFLVMELVDGQSLAACCAGKALDPATVVSLGLQLARALAYTHREGVIHRDIKPGNVLIGVDGQVKLADFGIARLVGQTTHHTQAGMAIGSPAYFSPEQVTGGEVTPAADVYALGLVLLEALTGQRAYDGPSAESAYARLTTPPRLPDSVPRPWRGLLAAMTALAPDRRPTAAEVAEGLATLGGSPSATAETRALGMTGTQPQPSPVSPATLVFAMGPGDARTPASARIRALLRRSGTRSAALLLAGAAAVALVVALAVSLNGSDAPDRGEPVPEDLPPGMEQPYTELHEAILGAEE